MMTFYIAAAVACVLLSAFFSAAEMALSSANRIRLDNLADNGSRAAALAVKTLDRFDDGVQRQVLPEDQLHGLGHVVGLAAHHLGQGLQDPLKPGGATAALHAIDLQIQSLHVRFLHNIVLVLYTPLPRPSTVAGGIFQSTPSTR